jgi:hypothetical protein
MVCAIGVFRCYLTANVYLNRVGRSSMGELCDFSVLGCLCDPTYHEQAYSIWPQFSGVVFDRSSLGVGRHSSEILPYNITLRRAVITAPCLQPQSVYTPSMGKQIALS